MKTLSRIFRHLVTTSADARRIFPAATLDAIQKTIAAGETLHRAEVRLIIEPSLSIQTVLNGTSSRERALELFAIHGIWDTEENCGVLVYIELADHKVEIIADRAANRVIDEVEWREICQTMTAGFARKVYGESVIAAMEKLNVLLHARFPDDGSRPNQLSDQPIML
ncbi:MAG: hypothetical protein A3I66_12465 [Burkholderiales bacterium RIFCSPLOWO2_02_FULL_57_36]|nr:MAG: hypothetical protein A3I66_12465 [Burkholderiales bacterium RIFCSPLOWO2_02_FULL_57_36]